MNSPEQTPESRPARERRVGTFTFGAVLVICGALMLVSMFFPSLDLTLALQLSPLILVCLGVEVLLASPLRRENPLRLGGHGALLRPGHRSAGVLRPSPGAWYTTRRPPSTTDTGLRGPRCIAPGPYPFFLVFPGKSGIMEKIPAAERKNPHV